MILSQLSNLRAGYGTTIILKDINFTIQDNERIGIIGNNGSGKTTLLKLLTGELEPMQGELFSKKSLSVGYLEQTTDFSGFENIIEYCLSHYDELLSLEREILKMEHELAEHFEDEIFLEKYTHKRDLFERNGGYEIQSRARGILLGLGFKEGDFYRHTNSLSGGEQNRLQLAGLLAKDYDLLILDEPTNHLDLDATSWLENHLKNYRGSILFVTHDRYFLDALCTRIIEVENQSLAEFTGNYSTYKEQKKIRLEQDIKKYEQSLKEYKTQQEVLRVFKERGHSNAKFAARAKDRQKKLEKMEVADRPYWFHDHISFHLHASHRSGRDVLQIQDLSMDFKDKSLFNDLTLQVYNGDVLGIIGPNGAGKTTLFHLLNGTLEPQSGEIKYGQGVQKSFYDQHQSNLSGHKTMIEEINDDYAQYSHSAIREMLSDYMFYEEDPFKTIDSLSGGERARLALFKLSLENSNLLLLDEPTNHLDLFIKEQLEQALKEYGGTIVVISHDRYFLNAICNRIGELRDGHFKVYEGNYEAFVEQKQKQVQENARIQEGQKQKKKVQSGKKMGTKKKSTKTLSAVEEELHEIEELIEKIQEQLNQSELYSDQKKYNEVYSQYQELELKREDLTHQWEELIEEE